MLDGTEAVPTFITVRLDWSLVFVGRGSVHADLFSIGGSIESWE